MNFDKADDNSYLIGMTSLALNIVLWTLGGHSSSYFILVAVNAWLIWLNHDQGKRINSLLASYHDLLNEITKREDRAKH